MNEILHNPTPGKLKARIAEAQYQIKVAQGQISDWQQIIRDHKRALDKLKKDK